MSTPFPKIICSAPEIDSRFELDVTCVDCGFPGSPVRGADGMIYCKDCGSANVKTAEQLEMEAILAGKK